MLDDIRLDDPITPPFPFLYCKTPDTFPFETAVRRWPSILTSVVNDVYKTLGDGSDPRTRQAKDIIAEVGKLRHEVMRDMTLRSIEDDGDVDVKLWNEVLEHWWQDPADRTFFKAPWLFAECYLYRRVREIFAKRSNPDPALDWGSYDPFASQKDATLKASLQSFAVMAEKLEFLLAQAQSDDIGAHETTFQELLMSSLWGNQVDLSLHSNTSAHGMQEDTRAHLEKMKEKIIVDDSRILWKLLLSSPRGKTVDIILDNAGFELLTDLLLAHFLIATKVCARVRFFGKAQPWFVSDTTRRDFLHTCATLSGLDAHSAESNPAVSSIAHTWSLWIAEGTWEFHAPLLFTTPYSYWHLKTANPGLYRLCFNRTPYVRTPADTFYTVPF
ncbi:DUF89-domain-containing protein [Gonapodya prolifera JEL478]|uniref:Sugar phosphate phosphatase n=1 Tax=Gonapodya prolifera (strain JEL478) TaxID=1344416 RepID=A0A139A743_GONPJ|nr:DUF89-domain-containing protein [Gonapodya prolifera JEL478]|eukprot:KXS12163.1 DUF89-domain-containing protein [Gonapodya prolifera JEL478]